MRLGTVWRVVIAVVLAPLVHPGYLLPHPDGMAALRLGDDVCGGGVSCRGLVVCGEGDVCGGLVDGGGLGLGGGLGVGVRAEWNRCRSPAIDTRALVYKLDFSFSFLDNMKERCTELLSE